MNGLTRRQLIALLPTGRENAVGADQLAAELGINTRLVGQLVAQAIEVDGFCIGSLCGERNGYFLIRAGDHADLEAGAGHTIRRAASSFRRARALQRNYERMPSTAQPSLFAELDELVSA